jgi:hypothetical protein
MGKKIKLGYFVWKGSNGFYGAVGGLRDDSNKNARYKLLEKMMKEKVSGGCTIYGIDEEEEIIEKWQTAIACVQNIERQWLEHKGWWTLADIQRKFEELDKVEAEEFESQVAAARKDTDDSKKDEEGVESDISKQKTSSGLGGDEGKKIAVESVKVGAESETGAGDGRVRETEEGQGGADGEAQELDKERGKEKGGESAQKEGKTKTKQ